MFDYHGWFERAVAFTNSLRTLPGEVRISGGAKPPLTHAEVDKLAKLSRLPIPQSLRDFWTTATSFSDLSYGWSTPPQFHPQCQVLFGEARRTRISGGPLFEAAHEAADLTHHFPSWADSFLDQDWPKEARLWVHSIPFAPLANGDWLGLYVAGDSVDPPVAVLCHDGGGVSDIIADNLAEFLKHWETLRYLRLDDVVEFCHTPSDRLDPAAFPSELEALQSLLRGEVRQGLVRRQPFANANEWETSTQPHRMIYWLEEQGKLDERKVRLFACACCRRFWNDLGASGRHAIEVVERFVDGHASDEELARAASDLTRGVPNSPIEFEKLPTPEVMPVFFSEIQGIFKNLAFARAEGRMQHVAKNAVEATTYTSHDITEHLDEPEIQKERAAHADLVRQIFGNPFQSEEG